MHRAGLFLPGWWPAELGGGGESWRAMTTLAKYRALGISTEECGPGMGEDACVVVSG